MRGNLATIFNYKNSCYKDDDSDHSFSMYTRDRTRNNELQLQQGRVQILRTFYFWEWLNPGQDYQRNYGISITGRLSEGMINICLRQFKHK